MLNRREVARALLLSAAAPTLASCASPQADAPANNAVLTEAMAGKAVPGMAAMVIRDFRTEPEMIAGLRTLSGAPVARGDRWHLGSDGKAMTATMVARLVEAGVLSWQTPLSQMLPALAGGMQPAYRDVTLPDLLSHRAGLPENIGDMDVFNTFYDDPAPLPAQRLRYIAECLKAEPVGPVRAERSYSNTGLIIAGACAEAATGGAFETLMMEQVFTPLSMSSVSFDQYGGANGPQGHIEGRIANQPHDANPRMFAPAGGMRMRLGDWSRFCIDHMAGEHGRGRLLSAETYRFLHTGQGDTNSALGWGAAPHPMNLRGPALTHSGSDGNWYALVCLFPENGNGVLVVANAAEGMGGDEAALAAIRALAATVAEPYVAPAQ